MLFVRLFCLFLSFFVFQLMLSFVISSFSLHIWKKIYNHIKYIIKQNKEFWLQKSPTTSLRLLWALLSSYSICTIKESWKASYSNVRAVRSGSSWAAEPNITLQSQRIRHDSLERVKTAAVIIVIHTQCTANNWSQQDTAGDCTPCNHRVCVCVYLELFDCTTQHLWDLTHIYNAVAQPWVQHVLLCNLVCLKRDISSNEDVISAGN